MDIDERGKRAGTAIRDAIGDVQPRQIPVMRANRPRLLAALTTAAIIAAVGYVIAARTTTTSTQSLLPSATMPTALGATRTFSPSSLGVTVTVPATWRRHAPASGFQYVLISNTPSRAFVLATQDLELTATTAQQISERRRTYLDSIGASISAVTIGTVRGVPAARLQYRLSASGYAVNDTEYDLLLTRHDSGVATYVDDIVVLGQSTTGSEQPTLDWIASTLTVR